MSYIPCKMDQRQTIPPLKPISETSQIASQCAPRRQRPKPICLASNANRRWDRHHRCYIQPHPHRPQAKSEITAIRMHSKSWIWLFECLGIAIGYRQSRESTPIELYTQSWFPKTRCLFQKCTRQKCKYQAHLDRSSDIPSDQFPYTQRARICSAPWAQAIFLTLHRFEIIESNGFVSILESCQSDAW